MTDWRSHITFDPTIRGGKPCIRGMRITVGDILGNLAAGMTTEQILSEFPELTQEDLLATLAWASERENGSIAA